VQGVQEVQGVQVQGVQVQEVQVQEVQVQEVQVQEVQVQEVQVQKVQVQEVQQQQQAQQRMQVEGEAQAQAPEVQQQQQAQGTATFEPAPEKSQSKADCEPDDGLKLELEVTNSAHRELFKVLTNIQATVDKGEKGHTKMGQKLLDTLAEMEKDKRNDKVVALMYSRIDKMVLSRVPVAEKPQLEVKLGVARFKQKVAAAVARGDGTLPVVSARILNEMAWDLENGTGNLKVFEKLYVGFRRGFIEAASVKLTVDDDIPVFDYDKHPELLPLRNWAEYGGHLAHAGASSVEMDPWEILMKRLSISKSDLPHGTREATCQPSQESKSQ
jgi:hypothetical protein